MVQIVTSERFALCGVQGKPASAAMRTTRRVRAMPPMYITSGCTTSTARISIMRAQVARSQSCSPPVTSMSSASATCLVSSSFQ